ncbi:cupin domain-containing protein [Oceanibium sediminis]|uniref:cupin domain-containing protein n=1 Tax=Oceanibium sediminis TaxID=2026339 RepID=UPI000DD3681A|nr:cupin domain-containing protein [Oceanibium sediminis]
MSENSGSEQARSASLHTEKADHAVGAHIRHLRQARSMSIKSLAERSGLSIALISQIERGISSASVRVLAKLADGLNVAISDMFEQGLDHTTPDRVVARKQDHQRIDLNRTGISKELLTPFNTDPHLDIYLMTIEPDGSSSEEDFVHQGEEAGVVLEGGMELFVDGKRYVLGEGDSFRFASSRPHRYRNAGWKSAKIMWVNYRS